MKNVINIKETIKQHILNNKREYIIIALVFITGIFLGVLFVNNIKDNSKEQIGTYVNDYITKMKDTDSINNIGVLKSSIKNNLLITFGIWFFGTTVIRTTYSFWNCLIQRIFFRVYNCNFC
ncbi:MAG: stage II sporulation protein M [Clostridia bacterium]|nr:stage II sporulation protein M [Clostridia bacterium]